jgi:hypothetical protein
MTASTIQGPIGCGRKGLSLSTPFGGIRPRNSELRSDHLL